MKAVDFTFVDRFFSYLALADVFRGSNRGSIRVQ